jgi:hypothetical protein
MENPGSKPFFIEYADKLAILLIPYLFFVSFCYNFSYWGLLQFDVYNYLDFQDLIKGVGSALQYSFVMQLGISMSIVLLFTIIDNTPRWIALTIFILALSFLIYIFAEPYLTAKRHVGSGIIKHDSLYPWVRIAQGVISSLIAIRISKALLGNTFISTDEGRALNKKVFYYEPLLIILTAMPIAAVADGYENAADILNNYRYNFIVNTFQNNEEINKYSYFKYLGKVGDYHFALSPDNIRRIIIPKESLAPLIFYKYDIDNKGGNSISLPQRSKAKSPTK